MSKVEQVNYLMRTLVYGGIVALVGVGGYQANQFINKDAGKLAEKDQEIEKLDQQNKELADELKTKEQRIGQQAEQLKSQKETITSQGELLREQKVRIADLNREVERTKTALRFLKMDHRLAQIEVLEQKPSEVNPDNTVTKVRFTEVDAAGKPIGRPIEATIKGKELYIDAQVVQFNDKFVELGDELRGRPITRFRRMFGENQSPSEGIPLDREPQSPGDMSEFEREMWRNFLEFANDPKKAKVYGVRAANGVAPSISPREGMVYKVELRSSGALTIRPEEAKDPMEKE